MVEEEWFDEEGKKVKRVIGKEKEFITGLMICKEGKKDTVDCEVIRKGVEHIYPNLFRIKLKNIDTEISNIPEFMVSVEEKIKCELKDDELFCEAIK